MRRVALIGTVALLVVASCWWLTRQSSRNDAAVATTVSQDAAPPPSEELAPLVSVAATRNEVQTGSPISAETEVPKKATLRGTVILLDEKGTEFRSESGSLELTSWRGGPADKTTVKVNDGTFDAPLAAGARFYPLRARLRDRDAGPLVSAPITVPSDGCVEIRMRWRAASVVHVRDARTGRDLPRIFIDARYVGRGTPAQLPPSMHAMTIVMLTGDSPYTIAPDRLDGMSQASVLFVRAEGYAWGTARFDARLGGETFVELTPASALDIDVVRHDRTLSVTFTLTPQGKSEALYVGRIGADARIAIDDLPAGRYVVSASLDKGKASTVLATQEVELVEGARAQVTLDLGGAGAANEMSKEPERADLSGRLVVPVAWKAAYASVTVRPLEAPAGGMEWMPVKRVTDPTRSGDFDIFTFEFKNLVVGSYIVTAQEFACSVGAEVLPGGTSIVLLEVPAPAEVSVRVVDAANGVNVAVKNVRWRVLRSNATNRDLAKPVNREGTSPDFAFTCPVGSVEVSAKGLELGYEPGLVTADIGHGRNEVVLRMVRCTALRVALHDGTGPVMHDMGQKFDVTAVDGDAGVIEWSRMEIGTTVARVAQPGSYRIALREPLAGFLVPAAQTVALEQGLMKDVVFRLTRKQ